MESDEHKLHWIEERGHEAHDQLLERVHDVNDRFQDEIQTIRAALHRRPDTGGEWEGLTWEEMNWHQRIASITNGYATLANAITLTGAALTASGMYDWTNGQHVKAAIKMGVGRGLDLVDGKVADITLTKSDKGAALDAGVDKALIMVFLALAVERGDINPIEAAVHGYQQVRIFRESVMIKNRGGEPNPSEYGKRGMAKLWTRAGGIVVRKALADYGYDTEARIIDIASQVIAGSAMIDNQQAGDFQKQQRLELSQSS